MFLLLGCKVEELDVAYVIIPEVVINNGNSPGEADHRAVAVRAVLEANSQGFYPLPARIPILGTGLRRLRLEAVVNRSGLSEEYVAYPMLTGFVEERAFEAGAVDTLRPTFEYVEVAEFPLTETFNSSSNTFPIDLDGDGETTLESVVDPILNQRVGRAVLTEDAPILELSSGVFAGIPDALEVWLEVEYRGDATLSIAILPEELGLPEERASLYNQGALPRDEWRKFYFDLRNDISDQLTAGFFRLGLLAAYDPNIDKTEQEIFIENIRFVYR